MPFGELGESGEFVVSGALLLLLIVLFGSSKDVGDVGDGNASVIVIESGLELDSGEKNKKSDVELGEEVVFKARDFSAEPLRIWVRSTKRAMLKQRFYRCDGWICGKRRRAGCMEPIRVARSARKIK